MEYEAMTRLFIAVDLPNDIKDRIGPSVVSLRELGSHIKPVGREVMHLTLLFIGEQPENLINEFEKIAGRTATASRPCQLAIGPVGFFPRVSFLTLTGEIETLVMASRMLAEECRGYLEHFDDRPFKTHVTVARHKENIKPIEKAKITRTFAAFEGLSWVCNELVLYKSDLTPKGPIYTAIRRFPFSPL
jgi:RNA 2',3'-cyclic 3'-phosphodiesterase